MITLIDALSRLKREGYVNTVHLPNTANQKDTVLQPQQFIVDKWFRIEELSDPNENCIVYAISSKDRTFKGTLINSYGIYSDPACNTAMEKLTLDPTHF